MRVVWKHCPRNNLMEVLNHRIAVLGSVSPACQPLIRTCGRSREGHVLDLVVGRKHKEEDFKLLQHPAETDLERC